MTASKQFTMVQFDQILPGEIFWTVTTRFLFDPLPVPLTFVAVKSKTAPHWAIYSAVAGQHPNDIARYGDKLQDEGNIRWICPCDDALYALYNH